MSEPSLELRDDEAEYMGGGSASAETLKQNRVTIWWGDRHAV